MTRYVAIRSEGGLIPVETIEKAIRRELPGQADADFGLERGRRLSDEIARAWSDALDYWHIFRRRMEALPATDPGTTLTRERWALPLLTDLLGYQLTYQAAGAQIGGKSYPISHRAGDGEDAPPVHIVGFRQDLDRRDEAGHRRMSPHALVQEYVNRSEHLWAIVTNGLRIRLLRDTTRTARPSYLEFDLQSIMDSGRFNEFTVFYRLCHRTRLPKTVGDAKDALLERYYQASIDEGLRIRDRLRDAVEVALKRIGTGLLQHPSNDALRQRIASEQPSSEAYYRQLLRLIYRLLFLMVAEERQMLLVPGTDAERRQRIYDRFYSLRRLRDLVERPIEDTLHDDLWTGLQATFGLLSNGRENPLGMPPLNGHLFGPEAIPDLEATHLYNHDLLAAIRRMSVFETEGAPARISYAALDVEELGSVYESLLDFHPAIERQNGTLAFDLKTGTERKSTGSYYTPRELVSELIENALVPVLEDRLANARTREEKEQAILTMTVCDPACGSGHFLLAAARRMARELAKVRSGEDEPTPEEFRRALRDVILACVHGVDKNPLAVDLCKVALWIEGHNPGKPLSFLDHRIKCGDSLVGILSIAQLTEGIPDGAYTSASQDDRVIVRELRRKNAKERTAAGRQLSVLESQLEGNAKLIADAYQHSLSSAQDNVAGVRDLERRLREFQEAGSPWWHEWMAANLWVAPFFVSLGEAAPASVPTTGDLRDLLNGVPPTGDKLEIAGRLAHEISFFHWTLEFPVVFTAGGFDVVLSNPPFMGGHRISVELGEAYRKYLTSLFASTGGLQTDLCAYFYRRAFDILRPTGQMGMVATNTIGEGDTRETGLAVIVARGGTIIYGRRFIKWPGAANLEVNLLGVRKGQWTRERHLDGQPVEMISSRLAEEPEASPRRLSTNRGKAFLGSRVRGIGFVLDPEEAKMLIRSNSRNRDCLFPYMGGEDLNSRPDQSPSRWVICFHDWPLVKAQSYSDLLKIVEERVKPEREKVKQVRDREYWWLFQDYRKVDTLEPLSRVLVRSRYSEYHAMAFADKSWIFSEAIVLFAFEDDYHFAILQSSLHEAWVWKYGSSLESRNRYTATDCFETFPFPDCAAHECRDAAAEKGCEYNAHRTDTMKRRSVGLTDVYNLFHNSACLDDDVVRLRHLHGEMDRYVLLCYGWSDLVLGYDFYPNERGQVRYTISPTGRREIMRRLLELNLRFAAAESSSSIAVGARRAKR